MATSPELARRPPLGINQIDTEWAGLGVQWPAAGAASPDTRGRGDRFTSREKSLRTDAAL